jgi:Ca-activated chloride channel family protein
LTSDPAEGDITTALDEVLVEWSAPLWAGVRLGVNRGNVQVAGRTVHPGNGPERRVVDLGDLPSGRPVWVVGRTVRGGSEPLTFDLGTASGAVVGGAALESGRRPSIATVFGARRVADLEALRDSGLDVEDGLCRLGYDVQVLSAGDGDPAPIYHENARATFDQALRNLLVQEGLRFGIACGETAFVATRAVAGRRVEASVAIANALPSGWSGWFATPMPVSGSFQTGGTPGSVGAPAWPCASALSETVSGPFPVDVMPTSPMPGSGPHFKIADRPPSPLDWARGLTRRFRRGQAPSSDTAKEMEDNVAPSPLRPEPTIHFDGVPRFANGRAVLYDSERDGPPLPSRGVLRGLRVRFPDGPSSPPIPSELELLLFAEDDAVPRARMRLVDFQRADGVRPLNVAYRPGDLIRLVLVDPSGAWAAVAPRLTVALD